MTLVSALLLTRFKSAAEKAAAWLTTKRYHTLFLDLPEDFTPFVRAYMGKVMPQERLWRSYGYLTGLQEPFVNALKYHMTPIFNILPRLTRLLPMLKVYCYQDLTNQLEASRLTERLLLLATGERVRKTIRLAEWRRLLVDELELAASSLGRIVETVVEESGPYGRNVLLYEGLIKPLKDGLEAKGVTVKPIYFQRYWRNPLDTLRLRVWAHGVDKVHDEVIMRCISSYLHYLDYILASEDVDAAHAKWMSETHPDVPHKGCPS